MNDYIFLMHDDSTGDFDPDEWGPYLARLIAGGQFEGGSAIGGGTCVRKSGTVPPLTARLSGYIRIQAQSLEQARQLLAGNPVFEAGGTVEIRELPRSG